MAGRKSGLLGLGNVGQEVLLENFRPDVPFKFHWLADSKHFLSKRDGRTFTHPEVHRLVKTKQKFPDSLGSEFRKTLRRCEVQEFVSSSQEAEILQDLTLKHKQDWMILDATSSEAKANYEVASSAMGCLSYCTASKEPWASL